MITTMKKAIKRCTAALGLLATGLYILIYMLSGALPDAFNITEGQPLNIRKLLPITAATAPEENGSGQNIAADSQFPNRLAGDSYSVDLKIFGFIPLKRAGVSGNPNSRSFAAKSGLSKEILCVRCSQ